MSTTSTTTSQAVNAETVDQITRIAHETLRAYREAAEEPPVERWHRMDGEHRNRERAVVQHLLEGTTLEALHEKWARRLINDGWRYGDVENATYRTHPSLLPYESLPSSRRTQDRLLAAVVGALA